VLSTTEPRLSAWRCDVPSSVCVRNRASTARLTRPRSRNRRGAGRGSGTGRPCRRPCALVALYESARERGRQASGRTGDPSTSSASVSASPRLGPTRSSAFRTAFCASAAREPTYLRPRRISSFEPISVRPQQLAVRAPFAFSLNTWPCWITSSLLDRQRIGESDRVDHLSKDGSGQPRIRVARRASNRTFLGRLRWNSYGTEGAQRVANVRRRERLRTA
jgi:hypothetical protein